MVTISNGELEEERSVNPVVEYFCVFESFEDKYSPTISLKKTVTASYVSVATCSPLKSLSVTDLGRISFKRDSFLLLSSWTDSTDFDALSWIFFSLSVK